MRNATRSCGVTGGKGIFRYETNGVAYDWYTAGYHGILPGIATASGILYHPVHVADSLLKTKNFKSAAFTYGRAFYNFKDKGLITDRYKAACAWALAHYPDSALVQLERIALKGGYDDHDQITQDICLISLHKDPRWEPIVVQVLKNKEKSEAGLNVPLIHWLDSLFTEDQKWNKMEEAFLEGNVDTISLAKIKEHIAIMNGLHYIDVKAVVAKYGFPNSDIVGAEGANHFWLLVQHQDAHVDLQQKVLALMKKEVDNKKASARDYAYLLDRVKVNTGQKQIYGTQMKLNADSTSFEPKPVTDPNNLNKRRKEYGMESIEEYTRFMNMHNLGKLKK